MKCSPKFRQVARSRAKTGDAMGRPTCESSFLELPNAKLLVKKPAASKNPLSTRRTGCISQTQASPEMGAGEGAQAPPLPLRPHPGSITCTMGTVRTTKGMLLSYLGTRTQTPSSSPDPFSCYEMQQGQNKSCKVCPIFCLTPGVHPTGLCPILCPPQFNFGSNWW